MADFIMYPSSTYVRAVSIHEQENALHEMMKEEIDLVGWCLRRAWRGRTSFNVEVMFLFWDVDTGVCLV